MSLTGVRGTYTLGFKFFSVTNMQRTSLSQLLGVQFRNAPGLTEGA